MAILPIVADISKSGGKWWTLWPVKDQLSQGSLTEITRLYPGIGSSCQWPWIEYAVKEVETGVDYVLAHCQCIYLHNIYLRDVIRQIKK